MGDRSNCSNPTVASEGGTSQEKCENAGTKCGNENQAIKKLKLEKKIDR